VERERPGLELDWKQSEVSPPKDADGRRLAENGYIAGEDEVEKADGRLHGIQQSEVDENTVVNERRLAEKTRPRWCVAMGVAVMYIALPT